MHFAMRIVTPIPFFLVMVMTVISVPAMPAGLSADDSPILQTAPLNPEFQDYLRKMESISGGDQAIPQDYSYGYRPPTVDLSHIELSRNPKNPNILGEVADYSALPSAFNWTTPTNYVTSVKNQLPCGTCWTFANVSAMESRVWISGGAANANYSEQALNCCTNLCWTTLAADRCTAGGNDFKAQDTFIKMGARLETCQPYNTGTINTEACLTCAPAYMTTNFVWVARDDSTDAARDAIKTAIQTYGPVTVTYYHNNAWLYPGSKYYYSGTNATNHVVNIVGWDDTVIHPEGGGSGAWKTKNSFDTYFGDSGYFWLCYGKSRATLFGSLMGIKAYNSNEKLYYWDEAGWIGNVGYGAGTAWMANMFTASPAGTLTHVDFYSTDSNEQYDIRVYKSGNINSLGAAATTQIGTCSNAPGYYSIPLTTPVALTDGQAFTVVVKMTTTGYGYPLAYENVTPGCNPAIQTGKSYIGYSGSDWVDFATMPGILGNLCLRARVLSGSPSVPVLTIPDDTAIVGGSSTNFQWSAADGATSYALTVQDIGDSSYLINQDVGSVTSYIQGGFPDDGTRYRWAVTAVNGTGSSTSAYRTFTNCTIPVAAYGYMGIGTENPQRPLHLVGNACLFQRSQDSAGFIIKRTAVNRWVFGVDELPASQFVIKTYPEGQPATVRMSIDLLGNITIPGTLSKGSGTFRIDHPLDPANKYISHSFVESPDMLNYYTGNAVLDGEGKAVVELPAYFEALNRDYSYQLEGVGRYAPLYIEREIKDNRFIIAGGRPGMKVSWQVVGIRQDPYANAHPVIVEQEKPLSQKVTNRAPQP